MLAAGQSHGGEEGGGVEEEAVTVTAFLEYKARKRRRSFSCQSHVLTIVTLTIRGTCVHWAEFLLPKRHYRDNHQYHHQKMILKR